MKKVNFRHVSFRRRNVSSLNTLCKKGKSLKSFKLIFKTSVNGLLKFEGLYSLYLYFKDQFFGLFELFQNIFDVSEFLILLFFKYKSIIWFVFKLLIN